MSITLDVAVPLTPTAIGQSRPVWVRRPAHPAGMGVTALLVHQDAVLIRAPRDFLTRAFDGLSVTISASTTVSVQAIRLIDAARSGQTVVAMLRLASPVADAASIIFTRDDYRKARRHTDGDFWAAMQVLGVVPADVDAPALSLAAPADIDGTVPAVREVRWMDWCTIFWWLC